MIYGNMVGGASQDKTSDASVFNADTHYDFPSIGNVKVIYKAESEKLLYQWNAEQLKYDVLCETNVSADVSNIELINGGDAYGTT